MAPAFSQTVVVDRAIATKLTCNLHPTFMAARHTGGTGWADQAVMLDQVLIQDGKARRTLFISDLHLGALSSHPDLALQFLQRHPADTYVLLGDILDLWQPLLPHWTAQDQAVIDHLRVRAQAGAKLIYIRGNHDPDPALTPPHAQLDAIHVASCIYRTATGKRLLVVHGDEADSRLIRLHAMTRIGSRIDHALRCCDRVLRRLSRRQRPARGVIDRLIITSNTLRYRGRAHEQRMVALARAKGLDGVICGHFHIAALHDHFGLTYANTGDWIDSMTALIDTGDGILRRLGGRDHALQLDRARAVPADISQPADQKVMHP